MSGLRLEASDREDLDVLSAYVQDAVAVVGDMAYVPRERRFALMLNRFRWEAVKKGFFSRGRNERIRAGLHFENVMDVKAHKVAMERKEGVLNLLALGFEPGEAPGGIVTLLFSGGASIRLKVEALDARLTDIGEPWAARDRPRHDLEEG